MFTPHTWSTADVWDIIPTTADFDLTRHIGFAPTKADTEDLPLRDRFVTVFQDLLSAIGEQRYIEM